jgi:hypothetical protein
MRYALAIIFTSYLSVAVQAQAGPAQVTQQVQQVECRDLSVPNNYLAPNETLMNGKACRPAGTPDPTKGIPLAAATPVATAPAPTPTPAAIAPPTPAVSAGTASGGSSSEGNKNGWGASSASSGAIAQTPLWNIVTPTQPDQKTYLDSLITDEKHHIGLIHPILLKSETTETNQRVVCSGFTSGTATTPDGSSTTDIDLSSSAVCRELADVHDETVMSMPDPANHRVWLIFAACTEGYSNGQKATAVATLGYGGIFMHKHPCIMQEGPNLSLILSNEKSGYYIYVGTTFQLGGKSKVSKYSVAEVKIFEVKEPMK